MKKSDFNIIVFLVIVIVIIICLATAWEKNKVAPVPQPLSAPEETFTTPASPQPSWTSTEGKG